jgi:Sec-independent protein secretion pathway component TatC
MDWKKKKEILWSCYVFASVITIGGLFVHQAVTVIGMMLLTCISIYCAIDIKKNNN